MKTVRTAIAALALTGAALPALANIITNPSFELTPGPGTGQGLLPANWINLAPPPGADTFSNDGSYGVFPNAFGNFPGVTAHDGLRWVAGGSGGIPINLVPEVFGQVLSTPLAPGATYQLSAYLIAAQRTDISGAGAYRVSLARDAASVASAIFLGSFDPVSSTTQWQARSFTFVAPAGARELPLLVFTPYAGGTRTAYPGIDSLSLTGEAVPEPGLMGLVAAGLLALGAWGRRRCLRP
ncbi:MAG TPA: hypothetical protein DEH78_06900 [Solibacterales bacterium]|nr:hypothetical protein [Bryobacterales bacterium]